MGRTPSIGKISVDIGALAIITIAGSSALITFVVIWMCWTGHRSWEVQRYSLLSKGEKLTFADFAPQPIPDDENFLADQLWTEPLIAKPDHHLLMNLVNDGGKTDTNEDWVWGIPTKKTSGK